MTPERLLPGADKVVRRILPVALESRGLASFAESLRGLPVLKDVGSVTFAVAEVSRAARGAGLAEGAVRLCGEAALAAVRGDAARFAELVLQVVVELRAATPGSSFHN